MAERVHLSNTQNKLTSQILESLPWIRYGFGTKQFPYPEALKPYQSSTPTWKQVHEIRWTEVSNPQQSCQEADALFTRQFNIPMTVVTADCVPILLARLHPPYKIAAVHAGWKGVKNRILKQASAVMGESLEDWVAVLGPSIRSCCFEVSEDLAQEFLSDFSKFFPNLNAEKIIPKHRHVDLHAILEAELKSQKIHTFESLPHCTKCSTLPSTFFSYRNGDRNQRQWSGLVLLD